MPTCLLALDPFNILHLFADFLWGVMTCSKVISFVMGFELGTYVCAELPCEELENSCRPLKVEDPKVEKPKVENA
jgi:hypothetical protein